jgi:hypothetical protein
MMYYVFIEYPWKATCIDWQLCELFVRLFTCMVILKLFLVGVHVWTHMNIRLAYVLVDDCVSQVIDMELSN